MRPSRKKRLRARADSSRLALFPRWPMRINRGSCAKKTLKAPMVKRREAQLGVWAHKALSKGMEI